MTTVQNPRSRPSAQWASFEGWDYNGMKERLQALLDKLDKSVLLRHAELIKGQKFSISKPFSAGQYWLCLELVAEDGSLVIARVRFPRHPDLPSAVSEEDELYSIACEVATMQFVRQKLPTVTISGVYAYEGPGSQLAAHAGAMYMLLEGFYGNTLQDVALDICSLPVATQESIMAQWAKVQTELATIAYPQIGSICAVSADGQPVIGRLSTAPSEGLPTPGPFSTAAEYFTAIGEAAFSKLAPCVENTNGDVNTLAQLGALVFLDIVKNTPLFTDERPDAQFPLNHMDLGTQNILVDDAFNFLTIIDWEFAQTAPWQVNHSPMPFPLLRSDEKIKDVLADTGHIAHGNISRQDAARRMYVQKFRAAGERLRRKGRGLGRSIADVLESKASRVCGCFSRLRGVSEEDGELVCEMVRLAFELEGEEAERYLAGVKGRVQLARGQMHSSTERLLRGVRS